MNRDKILAAVDEEEELEGQMPEEVWSQMQTKEAALAFLRRIVRLTKKGIKNRIFELLENEKTEFWVIVMDTRVVHGQGDVETEPILAHKYYDTKSVFPIFGSKEAADAFIKTCSNGVWLRSQKMELKDS